MHDQDDKNVQGQDGPGQNGTRDEFRSFLEHVYNEYIRKRVHRIGRYFRDSAMLHQCEYRWNGLRRAIHNIDYTQTYCSDSDDVYKTFRPERLRRIVQEIEDGVRLNIRLGAEVGVLDALDEYFGEIMSRLDIADFPEQEYDLLCDVGFHNPKSEIQGIICVLRMRHKERASGQKEKVRVSRELEHAAVILSGSQDDFMPSEEEEEFNARRPRKPLRWFKGLRKIGQGAAVSIGGACLATGLPKFSVSPEIQAWGTLVSATTGVGMILDGTGALQGE